MVVQYKDPGAKREVPNAELHRRDDSEEGAVLELALNEIRQTIARCEADTVPGADLRMIGLRMRHIEVLLRCAEQEGKELLKNNVLTHHSPHSARGDSKQNDPSLEPLGETRIAEADVDALQVLACLPEDEAVRRWIADQWVEQAVRLLKRGRPTDGRHVLGWVQRLDPTRVSLPAPGTVTCRLSELPWETQREILFAIDSPAFYSVRHWPWFMACFLIVLAAAALGWSLLGIFDTDIYRNCPAVTVIAAIFGPLLGLLAARETWGVASSPFGKLTLLYPPYLLDVCIDRLRASALMDLVDVSTEEHRKSEGLPYTAVSAHFSSGSCTHFFWSHRAALRWVKAVKKVRARHVEYLRTGTPDKHAMLHLPQSPPEKAKLERIGLWGMADLLVVGAVLLFVQIAQIEAEAWAAASETPRARALRGYLGEYPFGAHALEAGRRLSHLYDRAVARYERVAGQAPGTPVMRDILRALQTSPSPTVLVSVTGRGCASATVAWHLARAFGELLAADVLSFAVDCPSRSPPGHTMVVLKANLVEDTARCPGQGGSCRGWRINIDDGRRVRAFTLSAGDAEDTLGSLLAVHFGVRQFDQGPFSFEWELPLPPGLEPQ